MGISYRLGDLLRGVRRRLDANQRELAAAVGVGKSTVARVETGSDLSVRALERMLGLAGWGLAVVDRDGALVAGLHCDQRPDAADDGIRPPSRPPRDAAGRRYPAHLDVRRRARLGDWWFDWYNTIGVAGPEHTFDLARWIRDARRDEGALFPTQAAGQQWPRSWRRRWKPKSRPPGPGAHGQPRPPEHPGPPLGPGWALGVSERLNPSPRWD